MKKLIYSIFAVAAISMVSCGADGAETEGKEKGKDSVVAAISGTYNTAEGATIVWNAKHYADTNYVHIGTVQASGTVVVDSNMIVGGEFTFDLSTIDENGDSDYTKMLEAHFQDSTMFNVLLHPSATFTITGSEAGKVMGDLSVLGLSQAIVIEGELTVTETEVSLVGSTTVDMFGFAMPLLVAAAQAPADQIGTTPDPKVVIEIDLKLAK